MLMPSLQISILFLQNILVYLDFPSGGKTHSFLAGISVNKIRFNTAFCHCNMRRLIAAIHMMYQYSHAALEKNKFDKIAAAQSGLWAEISAT